MENKKKAQISIFIIVAIIMIIVSIFLLRNSDIEVFQSHDTKLKNQISTIVEDCIKDATNDGIFILGLQGGYINLPENIKNNPTRYIDFGFKVPNWDTQNNFYPTISSMQTQLEDEIKDKAFTCIKNDLKAQEPVFDIEKDTQENFKVDVKINDLNVEVESEYKIKFKEKTSEETLTLNNYNLEVDSKLGDMYNLAIEIYNTEKETSVLEELTLDQIGSANDYSTTNSMPSEGFDLSCKKTIWTMDKLKSNLKGLNNANFRYFQFEGTYDKDYLFDLDFQDEKEKSDIKIYYDNFYTRELSNPKKSFKNYEVNILMQEGTIITKNGPQTKYPFRKFEVTPSDGNMVKSIAMNIDSGEVAGVLKVGIPCMQIFNHKYNLDYDLMVKLVDKKDINNEFMFQFPLRVEIEKSNPKEKSAYSINSKENELILSNTEYCKQETRKYPVKIETKDINENPISGVEIDYQCINLKCEIGTSQKPTKWGITLANTLPEVKTNFPYCYGGKVIAKKEGYHNAEVIINTDDRTLDVLKRSGTQFLSGTNWFEVNLIPYKKFKIDGDTNFMLIEKISKQGRKIDVENAERIFITLSNSEYKFEKTIMYPYEDEQYLELLNLDNVKYNVSIVYTKKDNLAGTIDFKDWEADVKGGSNILFKVPYLSSGLTEDKYQEYFQFLDEVKLTGEYNPEII